jgi:hypothetical protein
MSAYPMGALTWGEMRDLLLNEHGVVEVKHQVPAPGGGNEEMVFLTRPDGHKIHVHKFPILFTTDEFLSAPIIRNICAGLKISPKPFGLPLG